MKSFSDLKLNDHVLITVPVLFYAALAREVDSPFPLSPQCYGLLDQCRSGVYRGIITTAIVARLWRQIENLEQSLSQLEEEPTEGRHAQFFPILLGAPKRVMSLINCELLLVSIEGSDFQTAACITDELKVPINLALDMAAALRVVTKKNEGTHSAIKVAFAAKRPWISSEEFSFLACSDLPWQAMSTLNS